MEFHSGALLETHDLVGYQSQGQERGYTLHYKSTWADPRPIMHFGYTNVGSTFRDVQISGAAKVRGEGFEYVLPGYEQGQGGLANAHFFQVPPNQVEARAALQADLVGFPTGRYQFEITAFVSRRESDTGQIAGSAATYTDEVVLVNGTDSAFGAGWSLGGLQQLIEHSDGTVLLVDGDGRELIYRSASRFAAGPLESPAGDFSVLERLAPGRYRRTMPNQMVYSLEPVVGSRASLLTSVVDRNGNTTNYQYGEMGNIEVIRDPVGLETTFSYVDGRVDTITDPAGRQTRLTYNIVGDLSTITDPDGATRTFQYGDRHLLRTEIDARGNREEIIYGTSGRVEQTIRKDGSVQHFFPVQTQGLHGRRATADPENPPLATTAQFDQATYIDGNGNVTVFELDRQGQLKSGHDSIGPLPSVVRDINNQVVRRQNSRGDYKRFEYDDHGNVVATWDSLSQSQVARFDGQSFPVGEGVNYVHPDDLNGDGHLDVVTANWSAWTVSVLLGRGDGTFGAQAEYAVGGQPNTVHTGDFNGDQVPDIAVPNALWNSVSVLLGNGDGTFQESVFYDVGRAPLSLAVGDLNQDDRLDIVTANRNSGDVSLLLGNGDGTFAAATSFALGSSPAEVELADMDLDGNLDIVAGSFGPVTIFYGNGAGGFSDPMPTEFNTTHVTIEDIDLDGDTDLLLGAGAFRTVSIARNLGDGAFETEDVGDGGGFSRVRSGDLNFDGLPDFVGIAGSFADSTAAVILSNRDGTYAFAGEYPIGGNVENIALGDFDEDGDLDLVGANNERSSNVVVLINDGDAGFRTRTNLPSAQGPAFVHLVDLDDDGDLDLTAAHVFNLRYQLANGDGTFADPVDIRASAGPREIVSGDLDNDGDLDLVTVSSYQSTGNFDVFLNNGDGTLADPTATEIGRGTAPISLALADFDGDQNLDVVIPLTRTLTSGANNGTEVHVRLGNGDGTFGEPLILESDRGPTDVVVGMFNSDNHYDIATANFTGDNVSLFFGNGNGTFSPAINLEAGDGTLALVTDDFDGDGTTDLAAVNNAEDTISLFAGTASGFNPQQVISGGRGANTIVARDINADQIVDLATSNWSSGTVTLLYGDGNGAFPRQEDFATAHQTSGVDAGDLNADGLVDLVTANAAGRFSVHFGTGGGAGGNGKTVVTYDPVFSQVTSLKDELERLTLYDVDPTNGNVRSATRVVGEVGGEDDAVTRFTHTADGQVATVISALGQITAYEYDILGRLTRLTQAVGTGDESVRQFGHDAAGNVTSTIDPRGNETVFTYDAMNRPLSVTDAEGNTTQLSYDTNGNLLRATDAGGYVTSYAYDALNRPILSDSPLRGTEFQAFDLEGNLVAVQFAHGGVAFSEYDARSRPIRVTDANGEALAFGYDADGNQTSITDAVGNTSRVMFDARDRVISQADPFGNTTTSRYDGVGNLIEHVDRTGRRTLIRYDQLDRPTEQVWLDNAQQVVNQVTYAHDLVGNVLSIADNHSELSFGYDDLNRVTSVDNAGTPGAVNVVLNYRYDVNANVVEVADSIDGELSATTEYEYDRENRLTHVTQHGTEIADKRVEFTLNELGQIASIARYGDLSGQAPVVDSSFEYDGLNRLSRIAHSNAVDEILAHYNYEYDVAGRISQLIDRDGTATFGYDDFGQLVSADYDDSFRLDESYRYDANGNRVESHLHDAGYVTSEGNRLTGDGEYEYEYDNDGSLTTRRNVATGEVREFRYDHRRRLVEIVDRNVGGLEIRRVSYVYDVLDRRIAKEVSEAGSQTRTSYVYDREDVILDFVDSDGSAGPDVSVLARRYLHGPGPDQVLAHENIDSTVRWYLADHLGTTRDLVDEAGQVVNHLIYDTFGNLVQQSDPTESTRYLFTSREYDSEVDLYYYRARYYDSHLGRFIGEDTIGFEGGDSNLYRYVANRPTQFADPSGNVAPILILVSFLAGASGAALTAADGPAKEFGPRVIKGGLYGVGVSLVSYYVFTAGTGQLIAVTLDKGVLTAHGLKEIPMMLFASVGAEAAVINYVGQLAGGAKETSFGSILATGGISCFGAAAVPVVSPAWIVAGGFANGVIELGPRRATEVFLEAAESAFETATSSFSSLRRRFNELRQDAASHLDFFNLTRIREQHGLPPVR